MNHESIRARTGRRALGAGRSLCWFSAGWPWLALVIGSSACHSRSDAVRETDPPSAEPAVLGDPGVTLTAPAPGRWRLANPRELNRVMLWVSHILIRHAASEPSDVSFSLADWSSQPPPPSRTREVALGLAREVWAEAQAGVTPFSALAGRYSEDLTTQHRGGSLGGITASMLLRWPQVLDALAATTPGQVSGVVETNYGFHVFLLSKPPEEARISGAHIVIGHDRATWLRYVARGSYSGDRSHARALARAHEVQALVLADPTSLSQLVERYSDHRDAAEHGDLGEWSSLEPAPFPREVDVLRQLRVGEVSEPLETLFGIQVLLRTPSRPRLAYAMAAIRIPFDPGRAAGQPFSKEAQLDGANSLLANLLSHPDRFESAQRQINGAVGVEGWTEGRGPYGLQPSLERVRLGEIGKEVILLDESWMIVKRLDPAATAEETVRFELPAPERPDIESFVRNQGDARAVLQVAADKAAGQLGLPRDVSAQLRAIHEPPPEFDAGASADERLSWFRTLLARSHQLLGDAAFERYAAVLDEHFSEALFRGAGPL